VRGDTVFGTVLATHLRISARPPKAQNGSVDTFRAWCYLRGLSTAGGDHKEYDMPDLGKKHECSECGAKFYDLGKPIPACPRCGASISDGEDEPKAKPKRKRKAPAAAAKPAPKEESFDDDSEDLDSSDAIVDGDLEDIDEEDLEIDDEDLEDDDLEDDEDDDDDEA
jgi:hypothetical protein